jgi:hypothetical protein
VKSSTFPSWAPDRAEEGPVPHLAHLGSGLAVARSAVLRQVDDLRRVLQPLPSVASCDEASATSAVDPALLAPEDMRVDRIGVVARIRLLPLVGRAGKAPCEEPRGLRPVPLALGDLGLENPLQSAPERRRDPYAS